MTVRRLSDQEEVRLKKFKQLKVEGKNPFFCEKIKVSHSIFEVINKYGNLSSDQLKIKEVFLSVAGRIMLLRQTFLVIQENWVNIQAYFSIKESSDDSCQYFKKFLDIGDFVFIEGSLFRTQKDELTVKIRNFYIVSKCLRPLPEKYKGLQDRELKIRNRVADCLLDFEVPQIFNKRSQIIFEIRKFLNSKNYCEVDTPILQSVYGGANAVPFQTYYKSLKEDYFLRIAPEIPLKKMIIAGWSKIYEIGKVFRNEGIDNVHNPEFTTLEVYTAYDGLEETMNLTEEIFHHISQVLNIEKLTWNGYSDIAISKKFKLFSVSDLVKEKTQVDFYNEKISLEKALELAQKYSLHLADHEKTVGHIFHKLFEELVESELIQPTFVFGFHKDVSPLSKVDPKNSDFTLRYELFIAGKEFSNGFAELNDPIDQLERFEKQSLEKQEGNKEAFEIDHEYIRALEYGLPPTGGIGIGVDRLVMLFTERNSIKDVIFFPHLRR